MPNSKELSLTALSVKKMEDVKAGCYWLGPCGCACAYREVGGSSKTNNRNANNGGGLISPQC